MKVEINDRSYCVETLIYDNERLKTEIIESAKTNRLVLDNVRADIEEIATYDGIYIDRAYVLEILDKYREDGRDYREKTVQGVVYPNTDKLIMPMKSEVTVRMTSDKIGQSLSLQAGNVMIMIPLEAVRDIIKIAR